MDSTRQTANNNPNDTHYLSEGFVPVFCKGFHPTHNPQRDLEMAQDLLGRWKNLPHIHPSLQEMRAWRKAGGWIGWLLPAGCIAIGTDGKEVWEYLKALYKLKGIRPGIHTTETESYDFFKLWTNINIVGDGEAHTRSGHSVRYYTKGKGHLILAPDNGGEWARWKRMARLPDLPEELFPANMEPTRDQANGQTKSEPATTEVLPPLLDDLKLFLKEDIEKAEKQIVGEELMFEGEEAREHLNRMRFAARAEVIKEYKQQILKFKSYLDVTYKAELRIKKDYHIPKWMQQAGIKKVLDKTRFIDVFNYLQKNTMIHEKGSRLVDKLRLSKHVKEGKEYDYVLVLPDYHDMQIELDITLQTIRLYVNRFVDMGILKELGKEGSRGQKIYGIGYWSFYGSDSGKRNWFLKETPRMKEMLRNFTVRDENGKIPEIMSNPEAG